MPFTDSKSQSHNFNKAGIHWLATILNYRHYSILSFMNSLKIIDIYFSAGLLDKLFFKTENNDFFFHEISKDFFHCILNI